ncbi:MAG: HAD family acid phosphatase [Terracidiphilus sp.]|jgi:acid phosphatase
MMNKCATVLAAPLILATGLAMGLAIGLSSLSAQQQPRPAFSTDTAAERIPNLGTLKTELKQYHDCTCRCGCYAHDLDMQADRAIEFLHRLATHRGPHQKPALILDIDDTALSTYPEMLGADFAYNKPEFDQWLDTAQAPAIPGTLRLYKEAQRLGISVIFITGRYETQRAATERNLRAQGFDNWKLLVMRPTEPGSQTIGAFKAQARGEIAAAGYTLALNVGDQWSDLKGKPEAEFSVKYPDPFYFIP